MATEHPAIVRVGDPVLRNVARALRPDEFGTPELARLLEHMVRTMRLAPGVGLAAPQIGIGVAVAVMEDPAQPAAVADVEQRQRMVADFAARERTVLPLTVLINPIIVQRSSEEVRFAEGCLSLPGYAAEVARSREVEVAFLNADGEPQRLVLQGWSARIAQHEIDHLNGIVYIDRMSSRTFSATSPTKVGPEAELAAIRDWSLRTPAPG